MQGNKTNFTEISLHALQKQTQRLESETLGITREMIEMNFELELLRIISGSQKIINCHIPKKTSVDLLMLKVKLLLLSSIRPRYF
jgi:hypothetical protein